MPRRAHWFWWTKRISTLPASRCCPGFAGGPIWWCRARFPKRRAWPRCGWARSSRAPTWLRDAPGVYALSGEFAGAGRGRSGARATGSFCARYIDEVLESREQLARGLEQLGARVFPSGANFVLADFGPGGSRLVRRLARRGILVRDRASEFGRDGFVRITAGTRGADAAAAEDDQGGAVKRA